MVVTARSLQKYQVEIKAGNHQFISDEPLGIGDDKGPNPFDLLLAGLASCTIITLRMYAERKQWPLDGVEMRLEMHSVDAVGKDGKKARNSQIETHLTFSGDLSPEQIERLEDIASRCPVHRTLSGEIVITTESSHLEQPASG
jgi:putative redox protein